MLTGQVWILDFGSQYTQLITRRLREIGFSSEIITWIEYQKRMEDGLIPPALVLSGGPSSIGDDTTDYSAIFTSAIPVLGICYGMHLMGQYFQGKIMAGGRGEYGQAKVRGHGFPHCPQEFLVWMSHGDYLPQVPKEFEVLLVSENGIPAAMVHKERPLMALQFHPEVEHTSHGEVILDYFLRKKANLSPDWNGDSVLAMARGQISPEEIDHVLCAFSGGVDSLVAASLAHEKLGNRLHCFFVDNGFLRPQDEEHIEELIQKTGLNIEIIPAKHSFYSELKGVSHPEEKRRRIGHLFIDVFIERAVQVEKEKGIKFTHLLQGTLYPDVIESTTPHQKGGKSETIKSHHNVGGLPEKLPLKLLEPLRFLFKDEVRTIGKTLGLSAHWVNRHPFPGPGIAVRILGEIHQGAIDKVRAADDILHQELCAWNLYEKVSQALTVFLPLKTVGIKGDGRCFEEVICVRLVDTRDFMTASLPEIPQRFLAHISSRIVNEVAGITRVVYDLTSKPPGTIEWE